MNPGKVIIFGGYGVFGSRIAADLLEKTDCQVILAGRNSDRAKKLCKRLGSRALPLACDLQDAEAVSNAVRGSQIVILAAGPFQSLPLTALEAALTHKAHYIDLTDSRAYRRKVIAYSKEIQAAGITALSGLSTLSGISAVMVRQAVEALSGAERAHVSLSPGNRNPRGAGTIYSILTYVGRPIKVWQNGDWGTIPGWTGREKVSYPVPVGRRFVYWVDAPDHDLLPGELGLQSVIVKAGLELDIINRGLGIVSWLRQRGPRLPLEQFTKLLILMSLSLAPFGTPSGAMNVAVQGGGQEWKASIVAESEGPMVAAAPAAMAAARLLSGELSARGLIPLSQWIPFPELVEGLEARGMKVIIP